MKAITIITLKIFYQKRDYLTISTTYIIANEEYYNVIKVTANLITSWDQLLK